MLVFSCGILVGVSDTHLIIYTANDMTTADALFTKLILAENLDSIVQCRRVAKFCEEHKNSMTSVALELVDPSSLEQLDAIVTKRVLELLDKKQEKWAFK